MFFFLFNMRRISNSKNSPSIVLHISKIYIHNTDSQSRNSRESHFYYKMCLCSTVMRERAFAIYSRVAGITLFRFPGTLFIWRDIRYCPIISMYVNYTSRLEIVCVVTEFKICAILSFFCPSGCIMSIHIHLPVLYVQSCLKSGY